MKTPAMKRLWSRRAVPWTRCWIAMACATAAAAAAGEDVSLRLETDDPVAIVRADRPEDARFVLTNEDSQDLEGTLRLAASERPEGAPIHETETDLAVAADAYVTVDIPAEFFEQQGMLYIAWAFDVNGEDGWSGETALAHMDPVGVTPEIQAGPHQGGAEFILGIAGGIRHHWDSALKRRFLEAAAIIGCEAYRMDMSWNALQPDPDTWNWDGLDEVVDAAADLGMFIQPLMAYGVEWALSDDMRRRIEEAEDHAHHWRYPPRLEPWREFNRAVAERYGTRMQYYEIWNEPDIDFFKGTAEEYLALLQAAYGAIKEENPEIIVTTAGFTALDHPRLDTELVPLVLEEGQDYFDAIAWHRHGPFPGFQNEVDNALLPLLAEHGLEDAPLVFNETALGRPFHQEWDLAAQLVKKMSLTWARGAFGHYWYNLTRSAPNYQMVNEDWTPRPSYPAYNAFARLLRGREFSHEVDLGSGRWAFAFRGAGHFTGQGAESWVMTAWTEDEASPEEAFTLEAAPGAEACAVDLMGNRRKLPVDGQGRVTFTPGHDPSYVVIEGAGALGGAAAPANTED